ncbi:MAG: hypothetical protein HKP37_06325 [Boseongicola sp.]|nr:hypothetical protein [Boseongicola sp.]NNL18339.1 hypothetical protein [Boseongicola sp.]
MLSQIADIADLIAAAAIIVSLLFVAYEIRATRKQTELTNWRELLQTLTDFKAQPNDPKLAAVLVKGHADLSSLSDAERLTFEMYLEQGVHIFGNFLKHNDALPQKLVGLDGAVANYFYEMLTTPGGAQWWEDVQRRKRFMPDTYTVTNTLLEKRKANNGEPI